MKDEIVAPPQCIQPELVSWVLDLYVEGVCMEMIAHLTDLDIPQVNAIIDDYSPYM